MLARLSSTSITRFVLSVGLLHLSSAFLRGRSLWSIGQRDHDRDSIVTAPAHPKILVGLANIDGLEFRCGAFHRHIVAWAIICGCEDIPQWVRLCDLLQSLPDLEKEVMALSPRMTRTTGTSG